MNVVNVDSFTDKYYISWPQKLLGPKILSEKELIKYIIALEFSNNIDLKAFLNTIKKRIVYSKVQLNNAYSRLGRLKNSNEAKKLYNAYKKQLDQLTLDLELLKQNTKTNQLTLLNILKKFPELKTLNSTETLSRNSFEERIKYTTEQQWIASEMAKINSIIKQLKFSLQREENMYKRITSATNYYMRYL